jgi:cytochrome c biogenesis protein ResB
VVHLGVVLVLVGGLVRMFGDRLGYAVFEGQVVIPESETVDYYYVRPDRSQPLNEKNFRKVPLGFQLRCLDFDEEKFPHSEVPRSYSSQVELQDGDTRVRGIITMAQPFQYKGYKFHQTSFAPNRHVERAVVEIVDARTQKRVALVDVSPRTPVAVTNTPYWFETKGLAGGSRWELSQDGRVVAQGRLERPGGQASFIVEQLVSDFRIGADREVSSASDEWNNPAVLIGYHEGDKRIDGNWFFYRPEFHQMSTAKRGDYDIEFVDYRSSAEEAPGESRSAFEVNIRVSRKTGEEIGIYWLRIGERLRLDKSYAEDEVTTGTLTGSEAVSSAGIGTAASEGESPFFVRYRGPTMGYDTILGVVKDPSTPITFAGCILIVLGPLLAFLITYRQLWGYYEADENRLYLALSVRGRSERPVKEYQRIVQRLQHREKR